MGYNPEAHVAKAHLEMARSEPLWMAHDAGHTPTTLIGQHLRGQIRVYAGLVTEKAGTRQHLEQTVLPWLSRHAPWILERGGDSLLYHRHDASLYTGGQDDIGQSPLHRLRESL